MLRSRFSTALYLLAGLAVLALASLATFSRSYPSRLKSFKQKAFEIIQRNPEPR